MRPPAHRLSGPLTAAALLSAAALLPAPALAQEQPVSKGTVVTVDLSRLPSAVARRGSATCLGARLTATGESEPVVCQRPFGFDAPVDGDPVVVVFRPAGGGKPTRHQFPYTRDPRPRSFTVPSAGTVGAEEAPPPRPGAAPRPMPPELKAQARAAAEDACRDCRGAPSFALKDFTVEEAQLAGQEVPITIQQPPGAP